MLTEAQDNEEIIERVAALDIGKAELTCCVPVPDEGRPRKRLQEVTAYSAMTRPLLGMLDRIIRDERISVHLETVVSELHGARQLECAVLRSRGSAQPTTVRTNYLLAMIGAEPHTDWLPPGLARDEKGFILTGDAVPPAFRHSHEWSSARPRTVPV